jgi:hypothetical protein
MPRPTLFLSCSNQSSIEVSIVAVPLLYTNDPSLCSWRIAQKKKILFMLDLIS